MNDEYLVYTPSGRRVHLKIPTPLTVEDKEWLHKLIDLVLDETMLAAHLSTVETPAHAADVLQILEAVT